MATTFLSPCPPLTPSSFPSFLSFAPPLLLLSPSPPRRSHTLSHSSLPATNLVEIVLEVKEGCLLHGCLAGGEVPWLAEHFLQERRLDAAPHGHDVKTEQVAVNAMQDGKHMEPEDEGGGMGQ